MNLRVVVFDEGGNELLSRVLPQERASITMHAHNEQLAHWGESPIDLPQAAIDALSTEICPFDCDGCRA